MLVQDLIAIRKAESLQVMAELLTRFIKVFRFTNPARHLPNLPLLRKRNSMKDYLMTSRGRLINIGRRKMLKWY